VERVGSLGVDLHDYPGHSTQEPVEHRKAVPWCRFDKEHLPLLLIRDESEKQQVKSSSIECWMVFPIPARPNCWK
jgi:hypothetical protein